MEENIGDLGKVLAKEEQWRRRYVSTLVDISIGCLNMGLVDSADHIFSEARKYGDGRYKRYIETAEFHYQIEKAFRA